ncbi:hypothetical protein SH611_16940 [Geminicoccaceae bacterium 1502E]|nr:hypothetical protein [Geminicoccaceae bacterium 1502E]
MERERYPGERSGLRLFLIELRPGVEHQLGADSLLLHAIRRALRIGGLAELRQARRLFNALPREQRQSLSLGVVARMAERDGVPRSRRREDGPPRE